MFVRDRPGRGRRLRQPPTRTPTPKRAETENRWHTPRCLPQRLAEPPHRRSPQSNHGLLVRLLTQSKSNQLFLRSVDRLSVRMLDGDNDLVPNSRLSLETRVP